MKQLELDLDKIRRVAQEKEDENYDFRIFLKGKDFDKVDKIVHSLDKQIKSKTDCQECGNCCNVLRPTVSNTEIKKLSKLENIPQLDYEKKYIAKDEIEDVKYLKDTPCKYLKDKNCTIYHDRPNDCRSYPHTHKKYFITRTLGMIEYCGICPIVYNLMENLKIELNYRCGTNFH